MSSNKSDSLNIQFFPPLPRLKTDFTFKRFLAFVPVGILDVCDAAQATDAFSLVDFASVPGLSHIAPSVN
jgi:hypothetical protein